MGSRELIARVQELGEELERIPDPSARRVAEELTAAVVELYGDGLARIMAALEAVPDVRDALLADGVVASLLLIHDLYPVSLEDRVGQALERVRPYLESHGGDVQLLGIEDGIVRLRLQGSCRTCAASAATLELAVRQALEELAPDLEGMDVEGVVDEPEPAAMTAAGAALPMVRVGAAHPGPPSWFDVDGVVDLAPEQLVSAEVQGTRLVIANVEGTLLAYRDVCASCGGSLHGGRLVAGSLACPGCGRGYDLPRAGRSVDDERLQLAPVPLLREDAAVRVALAS